MIIISMGRDPNNRIELEDTAQVVSNYHAELKIKDNGSMFLFDKSTNGTFVNGTQIPKTQDFPVYRGNVVSFANKATLNWSLIPEVPVSEETLRIMSIGKNPDNDIQLSTQDRISRYHALIRITKDNAYHLYDLSTNGVFVNNLRIPARSWYKVKYGDNVTFGGTDKLDWALVPSSNSKKTGTRINMRYLVGAAAAILVIVAGSFLFMRLRQKNVYERYDNTVCLVVNQYVYTLDFGELGKFDLTMDSKGNPLDYVPGKTQPMFITGTGFFISKDGKLITNRHVAKPWSIVKEEDPEDYNTLATTASNFVNAVIKKFQEANTQATTQAQIDENNKAIRAWFNSQVNITGHTVEVAVLLNNTFYNNPKDLIDCQVLKVADDDRIDISLLQTNTKTLPAQVKNLVDINDVVPDDELKPGKKIYILGFPMGLILAKTSQGIKANYQDGQVSRETDGYAFGHNISSIGDASGSPVFDEDGRLAGVHYSGVRGGTQGFKFAIIGSQVKKFTLQ